MNKQSIFFYNNKIYFRVSDHVEDELDLPITESTDILYSNRTDEELSRDPNVISNLEEVVMGWERHILKLIESYLAKV